MQFIFPGSKADLLPVNQHFLPVDIGIAVREMIMMMMPVRFGQVVPQLTVPHRCCLLAQVHAGLIQCHRVKGGQHADIGQDRGIIFIMAVTVGRYIHNQADMEAGPVMTDRLGIFGNLAAKTLIGG